MSYQLRDNVTYCQVDGRMVFLDLEQDRYFRLSDRMESVLLACLRGDTPPRTDISALMQQNIMTRQPERENRTQCRNLNPPLRSALTQGGESQRDKRQSVVDGTRTASRAD